jgi:hypothetical protein
MGPFSYIRSVVDGNVGMRRMTVIGSLELVKSGLLWGGGAMSSFGTRQQQS